MTRRRGAQLGIGLLLVLAAGACSSGGGSGRSATSTPTAAPSSSATGADACVKNEQGTGCLPTAPDSVRVDLVRPSFSDPARISNTRFPVGELTQVLQLGHEGGEPLRVEVTRLPGTKAITWNGQRVETVASQFVAYLGGRIREVATDYFAQADDGSVWYFGEDVANYEAGVVADHNGTWLTGKDGPPGMIMPGAPEAGDVYRPENIPGMVFEQDTIRSTDETVAGPRGPVPGAALVRELLLDGTLEEKAFAPGYGEFRAQAKGELVTVALAVPVDAAGGSVPAELATLADGSAAVFDAAAARRWPAVTAKVGAMAGAWKRLAGGEVPTLLAEQLTRTTDALGKAAGARDPAQARQAALRVEEAALDLQLRHRSPAEVDLDRLDLWARQLLVDAAAEDQGAVAGDVATLQVIWDRAGHTAAPAAGERVAAALAALRMAADDQDLRAAVAAVAAARNALGEVRA
jgi:hypothetical protein